jgi:hypothetical protein
MTINQALGYVGHNINKNRIENDFYPTPNFAIKELLKREKFKGNIWECACGDGAISKELVLSGYDVYSSDLIDRGYGESGIDFLKTNKLFDNIITNPPFNLATKFNLKALSSVKNKVVFLCKLSHLEGVNRKENLFSLNKLKNVYVFSRRLSFNPINKSGGMMSFAWFVFDNNYNSKPQIDWI